MNAHPETTNGTAVASSGWLLPNKEEEETNDAPVDLRDVDRTGLGHNHYSEELATGRATGEVPHETTNATTTNTTTTTTTTTPLLFQPEKGLAGKKDPQPEAPLAAVTAVTTTTTFNASPPTTLSSNLPNNSRTTTTTTATTTTCSGLGWQQFRALLHKNVLTKYRNPIATLMELVSPILLMLVLVLAFNLSKISHEPAAVYDTVNLSLPNLTSLVPLLINNNTNNHNTINTINNNTNNSTTGATGRQLLELFQLDSSPKSTQPAVVSSVFQQVLDWTWTHRHPYRRRALLRQPSGGGNDDDAVHGSLASLAWLPQYLLQQQRLLASPMDRPTHHYAQQQRKQQQPPPPRQLQTVQNGTTSTTNGTTNNNNNSASTVSSLNTSTYLQTQVQNILTQPMFIPSLDEYVLLSNALTSLLMTQGGLPNIVSQTSYGQQWGNLLTLGTLHLVANDTTTAAPTNPSHDTPVGIYTALTTNHSSSSTISSSSSSNHSTSLATQFLAFLARTYPRSLQQLTIRSHTSEAAAIQYIQDHLMEERTWAVLDLTQLHGLDSATTKTATTLGTSGGGNGTGTTRTQRQQFTIRMNYTTIPDTSEIVKYVAIGLDTDYQQYFLSGFLTLQRTLNEFIMASDPTCTHPTNHSLAGRTWTMPMPTAAYSQNSFFLAVGFLLGLTMAMAFLYPVSRLIKSLVEEKELRLKETLFILGVRPWAHWWSWLVTSLVIFFFIAVVSTLVLHINVLKYSSLGYLFVWIFFFATSCIGFSFTVASLFSRAKLAAMVGPELLFATILPKFIFFASSSNQAVLGKQLASLLPATAFCFGADIVANYEYAQQGIQSWNASQGDYSFNTSISFLFFDTFLYLFLGWYLDQVLPRKYGAPLPFYFLFLPSYWFGGCCPCSIAANQRDAERIQSSPRQDEEIGEYGVE